MFAVYCGDVCIFDDTIPTEEMQLIDPKLELEVNSAGVFTCTIPPTNIGYSIVKRFTSNISVKQNDNVIWEGRVINEEMDFWDNRKITCEGELAYLNDTVQEPIFYCKAKIRDFLLGVLTNHNKKVSSTDPAKKFYLGSVTGDIVLPTGIFTTNFDYTIDAINSNVIDNYGGYIYITHANGKRFLNYSRQTPGTKCSQTINFGENLLNFVRNWDVTSLKTVVYPLGAENEKSYSTYRTWSSALSVFLTKHTGGLIFPKVEVSNDVFTDPGDDSAAGDSQPIVDDVAEKIVDADNDEGVCFVIDDPTPMFESYCTIYDLASVDHYYIKNDEAVARYGWIEEVVHFDGIDDPKTLLKLAKAYLADKQFDEMTIKVTALDLSLLNPNIKELKLMDKVNCFSVPHGMDAWFPVHKIEYHLAEPEKTVYTLDKNSTTLVTKTNQSITSTTNRVANQALKTIGDIKSRKTEIIAASYEEPPWDGTLRFRDDMVPFQVDGDISVVPFETSVDIRKITPVFIEPEDEVENIPNDVVIGIDEISDDLIMNKLPAHLNCTWGDLAQKTWEQVYMDYTW